MQRLATSQFVRYIFVGGLNTAFSYSVYAALLYAGFTFVLANFVALVLGILFSFRTQGSFVFGNHNGKLIYRFIGCWCVLWLLNILIIYLLVRAGLNSYWAGMVAMVPVTAISYFALKIFVFGPTQRMIRKDLNQ